jgi:hypothetical protein
MQRLLKECIFNFCKFYSDQMQKTTTSTTKLNGLTFKFVDDNAFFLFLLQSWIKFCLSFKYLFIYFKKKKCTATLSKTSNPKIWNTPFNYLKAIRLKVYVGLPWVLNHFN